MSDSIDKSLSLGRLFGIWFLLGLQSFGGGGAMLTLIRRTVIERYGWLTEEEFTRDWALCQVCPGINLTAFTILIGRRIAGGAGAVVCLVGLMLPSVACTILLTVWYAALRDSLLMQAALKAIVPASVGLGLLSAYEVARPAVRESAREGNRWLLLALFLLLGSGSVLLWLKLPVVSVLATAGGLSAFCHSRRAV
ncbi:chromate transporter [Armatimonas sp.]|uniref:chromate transporter n=1 Tax=Armatimonas sp. TaxID=1872638 RepID=UPI00374CB13E